jgi:hypothetical protein
MSFNQTPIESYKCGGKRPWKISKNVTLNRNNENLKKKRKEKMHPWWEWEKIRKDYSLREESKRKGEGESKKISQILLVVAKCLFR